MEKNKTSEAQLRANEKYSKKFERVNTLLPPGTKARIQKLGTKSINMYIVEAVQEKLNHDEKHTNIQALAEKKEL